MKRITLAQEAVHHYSGISNTSFVDGISNVMTSVDFGNFKQT